MQKSLHFLSFKGHFLALGLIACLFSACTPTKSMNTTENVISSSVKVSQTSDYCGGAPPPEELLERLKTPKPFVNQTLYLFDNQQRSGEAILVKTNGSGQFTFEAEEGIYYVYLKDKMKRDPADEKNKGCKDWLLRPYTEFEINRMATEIEIHIHQQCNPCLPPRM